MSIGNIIDRIDREAKENKINKRDKRMVAWNAHTTDDVGVIWCMVIEDEAGYRPMTGRGELSSAWYLARLADHTDEDGKVNYTSLWAAAEEVVDAYNEEQGISRKEAMEIVASSMRLG